MISKAPVLRPISIDDRHRHQMTNPLRLALDSLEVQDIMDSLLIRKVVIIHDLRHLMICNHHEVLFLIGILVHTKETIGIQENRRAGNLGLSCLRLYVLRREASTIRKATECNRSTT